MNSKIRFNLNLILSLVLSVLLTQEALASAYIALKYLDEIIEIANDTSSLKSFDEVLAVAKSKRLVTDNVHNIDDLIKLLDDPNTPHMQEIEDLKIVLKSIKDNPNSWRLILQYRNQIQRLMVDSSIFKATGQDMSRRFVSAEGKHRLELPNEGPSSPAGKQSKDAAPQKTPPTSSSSSKKVVTAFVIPRIDVSKVFADFAQSLDLLTKKLGNTNEIFKPETLRSIIDIGLSQGHDLSRVLTSLTSPDELVVFLRRVYLEEKSKILDELLSLPELSIDRISKAKELDALDYNYNAIVVHLKQILPPSPSQVVRESLMKLSDLRRRLPNHRPEDFQFGHIDGETITFPRVTSLENAAEEFLEKTARGPGEDLVRALKKRRIDVVYLKNEDTYVVPKLGAREARKAADEIVAMMGKAQSDFIRATDDLLIGLSVDRRIDYLYEVRDIKDDFITLWLQIKFTDPKRVSDFYKAMHQTLDFLASPAHSSAVSRIPAKEVERIFARDSQLGHYLNDFLNHDSIESPWDLSDVSDLTTSSATLNTEADSVNKVLMYLQRRVYRLINSSPVTRFVYVPLAEASHLRIDLGFIHPDTVAVIKSADELVGQNKFATLSDYHEFRKEFGAQLTLPELKSLTRKSWSYSAIKQFFIEVIHVDNHVYTAQVAANKTYDILTSGTAFSIIGAISGILIGSKVVAGFFSLKSSTWELFGWEVSEKEKMMAKDKSIREARTDESNAILVINTGAQLVAEFAKSLQETEHSIAKLQAMKESSPQNEQLRAQIESQIKMNEEEIIRDMQSIDYELLKISRALVTYDDHYSRLSELLESNSFRIKRVMTDEGSMGKKANSIVVTYNFVPGGKHDIVTLVYKRELDEIYTNLKNQGLVKDKELRSDWVRVLMSLSENSSTDEIINAIFK